MLLFEISKTQKVISFGDTRKPKVCILILKVVFVRKNWGIHLSEQDTAQPNPTLPPVDYSFQYAQLTRAGSNPSQFNRF